MLSRTIRKDQKVYINNIEIVGIQDFNANYDAPIEMVKSLGMEAISYYNNNNILAEISINKLLIDKDPFINFIDDNKTFSGHVDYKNKYFAFNSGILTNYRLGCTVNQIPQLSVTLNALGEFGADVSKPNKDSLEKSEVNITDYSNIEIDLDDFQFNRIQSFNLNINSNKNIIYSIGNSYPTHIEVIPPIIFELEFGIKLDDYKIKNIRDLLCKYKVDFFNIKFNKFKNPNEELFKFTFSDAIFMGESYNATVDSSTDVIIKYHGYIDKQVIPPPSSASLPSIPSKPQIIIPNIRPYIPLTTTPQPPISLPSLNYGSLTIAATTSAPPTTTSTTTTPLPTTTSTTTTPMPLKQEIIYPSQQSTALAFGGNIYLRFKEQATNFSSKTYPLDGYYKTANDFELAYSSNYTNPFVDSIGPVVNYTNLNISQADVDINRHGRLFFHNNIFLWNPGGATYFSKSILISTDLGKTWSKKDLEFYVREFSNDNGIDNMGTFCNYNGISLYHPGADLFGRNSAFYLRSTDLNIWNKINRNLKISFNKYNNEFLGFEDFYIYKSTDGLNWTLKFDFSTTLAFTIKTMIISESENKIYTLHVNDEIFLSTNNGNSFSKVGKIPLINNLAQPYITDFKYHRNQLLVIAFTLSPNYEWVLLNSLDNGNTWNTLFTYPKSTTISYHSTSITFNPQSNSIFTFNPYIYNFKLP